MKYDIKNFTIEEKMRLLMGKNYWETFDANGKVPSVWMTDSPNGVCRHCPDGSQYKATSFPTISMLCNSWDKLLAYKEGVAIADDCIEKGADIILGPSINIKRSPLCGRNFEYCSEDPYLAGIMAKAYVEGMQSKGVGTSVKHYCANNLEYDRSFMTSEVDERTLREIYLVPFEKAVEAQPWTVMCSYNLINGVYASENKWLLDDILRGEFGFDGTIVSDWGATHHAYRATKATLDLTMPYQEFNYERLKTAYENGWITEKEIDERVMKIFSLIEKKEKADVVKKVEYTKEQRHQIAADIARESIVLLKNDGNVLPLREKNILVTGGFAHTPPLFRWGLGRGEYRFCVKKPCGTSQSKYNGWEGELYRTRLVATSVDRFC